MGFFSAAIRIAEKDIKVELRRSYEILSILAFSVSSLLTCSFVWGSAVTVSSEVASATLWIILFFTSVLAFTTSFTREMDRGTLGGLKTLPCPAFSILLGKFLYVMILLFLVEFVLLTFSIVFFNLRILESFAGYLPVFIIGIIDLSFAGSFVSSLVMFSEGRTLLLSFLLFPICMPVLISSVIATDKIIAGLTVTDVIPELKLLLAFLLCITAVASFTFKTVLEE